MKNNLIIIFILLLVNTFAFAENLKIESKNITLDKAQEVTIFENEVFMVTEDGNTIKSDYAEHNKLTNFIILKKNITAIDKKNNKIVSDYAEYNELSKIFNSKGPTKVLTSDQYLIEGEDIFFNDSKKIIKSSKDTVITDIDNNKIFLENFEYQTEKSIFKSIGLVKIKDINNNVYEFSQIYIDTNKKEILGTDNKTFINDDNFKINKNNKPRIFSNTIKINKSKSSFEKSVFTLCDYRKNDKCPPWSIQSTKMLHDNKEKTIYYDNAIVKVYNIPIFYFPKLSHPDPTVDRRSGFLPPSFEDTKNLGTSLTIPYFWAIGGDKNLTMTNRFFVNENSLFIGEYHQAFKDSNFLTDFGYTKGYKKNTKKKKTGDKSHFFSKFVKNFNDESSKSDKTLSVNLQNVSNDKYLKLYKIKSNLVDYNENSLENSINFQLEDENIFFGFNSSIYETLNENYNDKYEYVLPEITIDKNLFSSNKIGNLDLQTNYKVHNYDTNKFTNFLVNNFSWEQNEINYKSGLKGKLLGNVKNINYETNNVNLYKKDTTSEIFGAIGYLSEIDLIKNNRNTVHLLKPKMLLRYAPGSMRKEEDGFILNPVTAFNIDKLSNNNNFETGLSSTIGFDYNIKKKNKEFDFSVAQIINESENKKMATKTGLDEKLSDLVGSTNYKINDTINLKYNFALDQNYKELNYNEFGTELDLNPIKIDFNYLQEAKHIGNQEYFKTKIDYTKGTNGLLSFETKRNLITDSSEFYNLSYEYINDCLRAGLVYRREFYHDSEIEPENSLMFKITLTPFGDINSPSFTE